MKNITKKILASAFSVLLVGTVSPLKAETLSIYDDTFSIAGIPVGFSNYILSGRWGTWDDATSTFTQEITSSVAAAGYVDLSASPQELTITLNQTLNLGQTSGSVSGVYAPGTSMALAIFTTGVSDAQALNWSSPSLPAHRAVLVDTSWITPVFANNANPVEFLFTANTIAKIGSFSYNAGVETITLVPEPSTFSLGVAGLISFLATRKRRSA